MRRMKSQSPPRQVKSANNKEEATLAKQASIQSANTRINDAMPTNESSACASTTNLIEGNLDSTGNFESVLGVTQSSIRRDSTKGKNGNVKGVL